MLLNEAVCSRRLGRGSPLHWTTPSRHLPVKQTVLWADHSGCTDFLGVDANSSMFSASCKVPSSPRVVSVGGSGACSAACTLVDLESLVSLIHTRKALPRRGARGATTSAGNRVTRLRVAGVVERR